MHIGEDDTFVNLWQQRQPLIVHGLLTLCVIGLAAFWLQAILDLTITPVLHSPFGVLHATDTLPPARLHRVP